MIDGVIRSTTILGIRYKGKVAMGGDGQVTLESTVLKSQAQKVRKLYDGRVLAGFAGGAADAMALLERFEQKLQEHGGSLRRAAVELAKDWRTDKYLRYLEAFLGVMDAENSFIISGKGDLIEPDDGIIALGSGGPFALAATKAILLLEPKNMEARDIVRNALLITASICIYTNDRITVVEL
jgi:ATP-dependent HslUV protease subunit HslV